MQLLHATELIAGGILFAIAVLHLVLALKSHHARLSSVFAALAFVGCLEAFTAPMRQTSGSVAEMIFWTRLFLATMMAFSILMVWFAKSYANISAKMIPVALTAIVCTNELINWFMPYTVRFARPPALERMRLPWGEAVVLPIGPPIPWLSGWVNLGSLAAVVYVVMAGVRLWRQGNRHKALPFTLGLAPLVLIIYPYGLLVNRGIVVGPHLYSFGFLGIVGVMSMSLLNEVVKTSVLTKEVATNEHRWHAMLEYVPLLIAGCDREGRFNYVNPFLAQTTGFEAAELIGKDLDVLILSSDLPRARDRWQKAMEQGTAPPTYEGAVRTKAGLARMVVWSNVVLRDENNGVLGLLKVGSDVTEARTTLKARDLALQEIQELKTQLEQENTYLKLEIEEVTGSNQIIGHSDAIRYVHHKIRQVAGTDATVLIEGETGVGKELVARSVHEQSERSRHPFVRVNCAALPTQLIESELFGHERGAFTGADRLRKGRFELANGGTIFLDEIGELSLEVQAKLLRVLQEGEYERVGSSETRKTNARVIAATNRELKRDVAAGRFRADLFYRINVYPISVPPLRERRDDIPALVKYFSANLATRHRKVIEEIPASLMQKLTELEWPGNVRELENVIERAVITSRGRTLAWPGDFSLSVPAWPVTSASGKCPMTTLAEMEKKYIEEVLTSTHGQVGGDGGAATILGLHPNTLRARMAKLGVSASRPIGNGRSLDSGG